MAVSDIGEGIMSTWSQSMTVTLKAYYIKSHQVYTTPCDGVCLINLSDDAHWLGSYLSIQLPYDHDNSNYFMYLHFQ